MNTIYKNHLIKKEVNKSGFAFGSRGTMVKAPFIWKTIVNGEEITEASKAGIIRAIERGREIPQRQRCRLEDM